MEENKNTCSCTKKYIAFLILALGILGAGFAIGCYYYHAKMDNNFVVVKGLAEQDVKADLAVWDLKYVLTGNDVIALQKKLTEQQNIIVNHLKKQGFEDSEINIGRLNTNDLTANPYRSEQLGTRFILNQTITISSKKVELVEKSIGTLSELVAQGIIFDNQEYSSPVAYIFTKLNDIKPQMLSTATEKAKAAANEFAKSSGTKVGKIHRAQQGVFSILPREEAPGVMESQQINKKVRVVSTIEYYLD
ncbi:MAG: SIMPL domain-containing protein [Elusimicrobiaceae bacterium]|nr:SIMPL domain-containing protein [Elusimicrobiaceae bacterium]MBQ6224172.1 SIMPL domain-containing protein [Campylobacter sp.]